MFEHNYYLSNGEVLSPSDAERYFMAAYFKMPESIRKASEVYIKDIIDCFANEYNTLVQEYRDSLINFYVFEERYGVFINRGRGLFEDILKSGNLDVLDYFHQCVLKTGMSNIRNVDSAMDIFPSVPAFYWGGPADARVAKAYRDWCGDKKANAKFCYHLRNHTTFYEKDEYTFGHASLKLSFILENHPGIFESMDEKSIIHLCENILYKAFITDVVVTYLSLDGIVKYDTNLVDELTIQRLMVSFFRQYIDDGVWLSVYKGIEHYRGSDSFCSFALLIEDRFLLEKAVYQNGVNDIIYPNPTQIEMLEFFDHLPHLDDIREWPILERQKRLVEHFNKN